ncbi:hypothetical protein P153DRAFT_429557 [Dothidotthia symphoricarpi CBS 119687]|uniref:DUF7730 domain-containing protein n=1 Tax=Dothidotthia symphoricarpi CBS 119687 TaxID=1392245 RepID=A0A6A6ANF2_9PLEO|nr:uncharacterized protein P153DRAFT_429557 [Dothidotthia symphoricarpi CBS 119687]KAF2132417.1 hypothetical protein P153DRAFT_429557 [Dothidotthia symphoricarpi CBS 119687]
MVGKRTYSNREKQRNAYKNDPSPDSRKRLKQDDTDEQSWLTPTSSRTGTVASTLKRASGRFGGPVSIPEDGMDVEKCSEPNGKPTSVFDKVANGRSNLAIPQQASIHGSRDAFNTTMKGRRNSKQSNTRPQSSYLPTPPAEVQKPSGYGISSRPSSSNGCAISPASKTATANGSIETSKLLEKIIDNEKTEPSYTPREYESDKTPAPRKDIHGDYMSKRSKEARLWHANQSNSPLLRLPANVRERIYKHVLGGNTINICYKTYQLDRTGYDKPPILSPVFKYHCTVFKGKASPYKQTEQPWIKTSTGFTLLNGVCRQLHQETSIMPYELNVIAFDSHLTMWNFLFMENRLSRKQRHAITHLMLPDAQPQANMLTYLPNLAKFFLGRQITMEDHTQLANGWYKVIRLDGREPKLVHSRNIW